MEHTTAEITKDNLWFINFVILELSNKYFNEDFVTTYQRLKETKFLDLLISHYDVLHTQDIGYIFDLASAKGIV